MKYLFAASEVAGFAKTGGLADVAAALPPALAQRGHECMVVMPLYQAIRKSSARLELIHHILSVPIGNYTVTGSLWRTSLPGSNVPLYLIAQPDYFERDDPKTGKSLYQYRNEEGKTVDYPDNCERFIFFCRAILEALRLLNFWPDVLHANDWHTGLVPVFLKEIYSKHPDRDLRHHYHRVHTLFTIHNIAYQGMFWQLDMPLTGLSWDLFNHHQLEFYGHLNFLKAGIVFSDVINAVSPTYAREIQTSIYGAGLQNVLLQRTRDLYGIVNGVDYRVWDPAIDSHLAARYTPETVQEGKPICKQALQKKMNLPTQPNIPLLGMISRLVAQKGLDLLENCAKTLLQEDVQLVVLGDGEKQYKDMLLKVQKQYPNKVSVKFALDEELAHQIEAGADMFLMPSLFEPCGLNQLYSLRYGTVPIVRKTGGLADTVADASPEILTAGTATGFVFIPPSGQALLEAVQRAIHCYRDRPAQWLTIMQTGMRQDWSWNQSAVEYEKLFEKMISARDRFPH